LWSQNRWQNRSPQHGAGSESNTRWRARSAHGVLDCGPTDVPPACEPGKGPGVYCRRRRWLAVGRHEQQFGVLDLVGGWASGQRPSSAWLMPSSTAIAATRPAVPAPNLPTRTPGSGPNSPWPTASVAQTNHPRQRHCPQRNWPGGTDVPIAAIAKAAGITRQTVCNCEQGLRSARRQSRTTAGWPNCPLSAHIDRANPGWLSVSLTPAE
jgi:hypothetical protein